MEKGTISLQEVDFEPLTEVKARLSEKVARIDREGRLLAITLNGKPKVLMVPYEEFLNWMKRQAQDLPLSTIDLKQWERESPERREVSRSIQGLFDLSSLTRKGQKPYKKNALKGFKKV